MINPLGYNLTNSFPLNFPGNKKYEEDYAMKLQDQFFKLTQFSQEKAYKPNFDKYELNSKKSKK